MSSISNNHQNEVHPIRVDTGLGVAEKAETDRAVTLDFIQTKLERSLGKNDSQAATINEMVEIACRATNAIWCGQFSLVDSQTLHCTSEYNAVATQNLGLTKSSLLPTAEISITTGLAKVTKSGELTVISTPIYRLQGSEPVYECLTLALNLGQESAASFLLILQLAATYVGKFYERENRQNLSWKVDAVAAIAELTSEISSQENKQHVELMAANRLASFLKAEKVAIGYRVNGRSMRTRVVAVSGDTEVKSHSPAARNLASAMNESLVRDSVTTVPAQTESDRCMTLANRELQEDYPDCSIVTSPLTTSDGRTIGAWVCILPAGEVHQSHSLTFATTVSSYLADALDVTIRASEGPFARLKRSFREFANGNMGKIVASSLLALILFLAIPITYRIDCNCVLRPEKRHFAVAPYNGMLESSFARSGDIVSQGQVLARMDDQELQLEKIDLIAQKEAAIKQRDVHHTASDPAATKIAEMKIRQLDAKLELLTHRLDHLEIKATSDGVVLRGDFEDAEGAPVRTGDVLMEIAKLDELDLEVEIPANEINRVQSGLTTYIVLDGNPFERFEGVLDRIRPASEVRENQNVFVANIRLSNTDQLLRPGMKGRAKIDAGFRSIGWVLFHRPCEKVFALFR
ncbi:MAG: efflux RND transporter periplasmic adaptor subunit [Planctomycetota bacterium]